VAPALAEVLRHGGEATRPLHFAARDWVASHSPLHEPGERGARGEGSAGAEGAERGPDRPARGAVIVLYDAEDIASADSRLRAQRKGQRRHVTRHRFDDLLGADSTFERVRALARRYAATDLTVLVTGETGTGKELFAQSLHAASARAGRPFVALNCSALPEPLLESELFGYEEGAFTGARRGGKAGLFEAAHTGTLFLDEIGDMPVPLQARLLRVLQEREVLRLGGTSPVPVDVRVVAATHADLAEAIAAGRFRRDLYYRLNLLHLNLPPLRERGDDVLLLALAPLARTLSALGSTLEPAAVLRWAAPLLRRHGWPGNVRELDNVCTRLAVFVAPWPALDGSRCEALYEALPELQPELQDESLRGAGAGAATPTLQEALRASGGRRAAAAALLGISRATLWRRLREAGLG
jgi:propionate catabolism operon transcriptional regulator